MSKEIMSLSRAVKVFRPKHIHRMYRSNPGEEPAKFKCEGCDHADKE